MALIEAPVYGDDPLTGRSDSTDCNPLWDWLVDNVGPLTINYRSIVAKEGNSDWEKYVGLFKSTYNPVGREDHIIDMLYMREGKGWSGTVVTYMYTDHTPGRIRGRNYWRLYLNIQDDNLALQFKLAML